MDFIAIDIFYDAICIDSAAGVVFDRRNGNGSRIALLSGSVRSPWPVIGVRQSISNQLVIVMSYWCHHIAQKVGRVGKPVGDGFMIGCRSHFAL